MTPHLRACAKMISVTLDIGTVGEYIMQLAIKYLLFAFIAMFMNICLQEIIVRNYVGSYAILGSMLLGTAGGLLIKYILDKRYIFFFRTENLAQGTHAFILYTLMGVLTTCMFWGIEFTFHHLFGTKEMRYLGAVIGLSIGYLSKYHLDKRYVFRAKVTSYESNLL